MYISLCIAMMMIVWCSCTKVDCLGSCQVVPDLLLLLFLVFLFLLRFCFLSCWCSSRVDVDDDDTVKSWTRDNVIRRKTKKFTKQNEKERRQCQLKTLMGNLSNIHSSTWIGFISRFDEWKIKDIDITRQIFRNKYSVEKILNMLILMAQYTTVWFFY